MVKIKEMPHTATTNTKTISLSKASLFCQKLVRAGSAFEYCIECLLKSKEPKKPSLSVGCLPIFEGFVAGLDY